MGKQRKKDTGKKANDTKQATIPEKPKGKNAYRNQTAIQENVLCVNRLLWCLRSGFSTIAEENDEDKNKKTSARAAPDDPGIPPRLRCDRYHLHYYIDFTVAPSSASDPCSIEGRIIYGVCRTLCLRAPDREACKTKTDCKNCQRTVRCDHREDKPLISFSVNKNGLIRSSGELEGEWWVGVIEDEPPEPIENDKPFGPIEKLADLHYRALDHIWRDALDWTNENILP